MTFEVTHVYTVASSIRLFQQEQYMHLRHMLMNSIVRVTLKLMPPNISLEYQCSYANKTCISCTWSLQVLTFILPYIHLHFVYIFSIIESKPVSPSYKSCCQLPRGTCWQPQWQYSHQQGVSHGGHPSLQVEILMVQGLDCVVDVAKQFTWILWWSLLLGCWYGA
jgi:hypothetical protein